MAVSVAPGVGAAGLGAPGVGAAGQAAPAESRALLALLADGRPHSTVRLAAALGVSRAKLRAGIERLRALGIEIESPPRRGHHLSQPVELLDADLIRAALAPTVSERLNSLEVLFEVDSTNTRLLGAAPPGLGRADVCLSELQHAGRGRRGRRWIAPFGSGLALSLAWSFRDAARAAPALSLAVGVAICRALTRIGAQGMRLKWPNDVWFEDRKVGGVLLERRAEAGGPAQVVIGIGLNVLLSGAARAGLERTGVRVAAVADACAAPPSRNRLAGTLLDELLSMLASFEREGFAPLRTAWLALDALAGRPARVLAGTQSFAGTARGVDAEGALLLEGSGGLQRYVSGEVSLTLDVR
jgi:BirA family biotin operon repressor/biotin-[acetyl-CoA-carboxylase] ligase